MSKPKDTMEVNPYTTINNLYTLYGKKCVEIEAFQNIVKLLKVEIKSLREELKELKDNGNTGSN